MSEVVKGVVKGKLLAMMMVRSGYGVTRGCARKVVTNTSHVAKIVTPFNFQRCKVNESIKEESVSVIKYLQSIITVQHCTILCLSFCPVLSCPVLSCPVLFWMCFLPNALTFLGSRLLKIILHAYPLHVF
jgi:glutamine amidotransferase PdxT